MFALTLVIAFLLGVLGGHFTFHGVYYGLPFVAFIGVVLIFASVFSGVWVPALVGA